MSTAHAQGMYAMRPTRSQPAAAEGAYYDPRFSAQAVKVQLDFDA